MKLQTDCCSWEPLSRLRLINGLNTAKYLAERSRGSVAETTLDFNETVTVLTSDAALLSLCGRRLESIMFAQV